MSPVHYTDADGVQHTLIASDVAELVMTNPTMLEPWERMFLRTFARSADPRFAEEVDREITRLGGYSPFHAAMGPIFLGMPTALVLTGIGAFSFLAGLGADSLTGSVVVGVIVAVLAYVFALAWSSARWPWMARWLVVATCVWVVLLAVALSPAVL